MEFSKSSQSTPLELWLSSIYPTRITDGYDGAWFLLLLLAAAGSAPLTLTYFFCIYHCVGRALSKSNVFRWIRKIWSGRFRKVVDGHETTPGNEEKVPQSTHVAVFGNHHDRRSGSSPTAKCSIGKETGTVSSLCRSRRCIEWGRHAEPRLECKIMEVTVSLSSRVRDSAIRCKYTYNQLILISLATVE